MLVGPSPFFSKKIWSRIISTLFKSFQCQFDAKVLWIRISCCRIIIFILRSSEVKEDSLWSYQVIEGQGLITTL